MSLFQQEVKKRIGPYMKQKGFRLRNRTYYYIKNDIAFCISFEQPTGSMYTWAHVNPLYVPHEFIFLSYGNRLNDMSDVKLPTLDKGSDTAEIDAWCELFFRGIDEHILPFFQQIETPKKFLAYVEQPKRKIYGDPEELRMYTYLYLRDYTNSEAAISAYQNSLLGSRLIATLREKRRKEADEIKLLIAKGDEAVNDFCEQTIANTTRLFLKSK